LDFRAAVAELEALVQTLEREGDERALMLLQLVDAIHRPALARIAAGDLEHPLAQALLAMYDLAPVDDELDVEEALDEVRPYIQSHGGEVELLGVEDGAVHVRLSGACQGCAGSAITLQRGIEEALREHYAGFTELVAHEPDGPALLSLENNLKRPVFADACSMSELAPGEVRAVVVDDVPVLLANVGRDVYAVKNQCPVDGMPLEGGRLTDAVLVCPWHNCAFDVRSGKRLDEPEQPGLAVVPIALRDGAVRVAVNVA
jgi:nitrite reductase/ring-hydroxylating ferredoxin subunit/Fe-S cluster biogenesis protein NfuA